MHLPVVLTQTIEIPVAEDLRVGSWHDRFLREAGAQLRQRKARAVRIKGERLEFLGPFLLFTSGWNSLIPITSGWIEVYPREAAVTMQYQLSFRRLFWLAILLAGFVLYAFRMEDLPMTSALVVVAFTLFWLFLIRFVLTVVLFDALMTKAFESTRANQD
jgi:hypothetical protein